jgi:hypothetical protein
MTRITTADVFTMPLEVRDLLGPAPVLSTEDARRYEKILKSFAQCVQPRDFIEWMLVRDLADERWEIERLRRFKHQLVEELYKVHVAQRTEVAKARFETEVWGLCVTARGVLTGEKLEPEVRAEREKQLNVDIKNLQNKTAEQILELNKAPTTADFVRVGQEWLLLYERIEKLERAAGQAFHGVLEEIDRYREGLGPRLRKACDEIIEGEFEEAPSTSRPDDVPSPASSSALVEAPLSTSKRLADPNGAQLGTEQ